jgi:hypothetical protein
MHTPQGLGQGRKALVLLSTLRGRAYREGLQQLLLLHLLLTPPNDQPTWKLEGTTFS